MFEVLLNFPLALFTLFHPVTKSEQSLIGQVPLLQFQEVVSQHTLFSVRIS